MQEFFPWVGLIVLVLLFLIVDLGIFNRTPHAISIKEALTTSLVWIGLSLLFNLFIWHSKGADLALAFFTGYLLEKLLSLDNMFVFVMLFNFFKISPRHQHRVLFWGVLGAIVFRLLLISIGIKLIESFEWIFYLFGALLVYSGYKIYKDRQKPEKGEANALLPWIKKWIPIQEDYRGPRFFLYKKRKWVATPLFLLLIIIETSDIVFAIDSIPAIFAITLDPYIVFTSNIFAILGLRSLYFLLANVIHRFYYLQHALAGILGFIGIKLCLANHYKIPLGFSLILIICTLSGAIVASLWKDRNDKKTH